ncbi:hypothetical protein K432DRAFT_406860 [Lepidopterella palustris CBS 459.81]|uniref:Uncharacterized protein n=1 Tax=Lepidopterella palustris CBS 459.81 TaxID=1314670 RepID=A0A8E2E5W7_9PEZI|nr:hypothetical protein K432DRAFT_406860 [Lepidopterella palustris CBS 459.81]
MDQSYSPPRVGSHRAKIRALREKAQSLLTEAALQAQILRDIAFGLEVSGETQTPSDGPVSRHDSNHSRKSPEGEINESSSPTQFAISKLPARVRSHCEESSPQLVTSGNHTGSIPAYLTTHPAISKKQKTKRQDKHHKDKNSEGSSRVPRHINRPTTPPSPGQQCYAIDGIFKLTSTTPSSPGTLQAFSTADPSSPGTLQAFSTAEPSLAGTPQAFSAADPSSPSTLLGESVSPGILTSPSSPSTMQTMSVSQSDSFEDNTRTKAQAEPKLSNLQKEIWKTEWFAAGKPGKLAEFARMKHATLYAVLEKEESNLNKLEFSAPSLAGPGLASGSGFSISSAPSNHLAVAACRNLRRTSAVYTSDIAQSAGSAGGITSSPTAEPDSKRRKTDTVTPSRSPPAPIPEIESSGLASTPRTLQRIAKASISFLSESGQPDPTAQRQGQGPAELHTHTVDKSLILATAAAPKPQHESKPQHLIVAANPEPGTIESSPRRTRYNGARTARARQVIADFKALPKLRASGVRAKPAAKPKPTNSTHLPSKPQRHQKSRATPAGMPPGGTTGSELLTKFGAREGEKASESTSGTIPEEAKGKQNAVMVEDEDGEDEGGGHDSGIGLR